MAISHPEFAVPVPPSSGTPHPRPPPHRATPRRPSSPSNAEASSSKRRLDTSDSSFRQRTSHGKKVERRVLPARIGSSTATAGGNASSTARELDDMVMECFAKAFLETYQPSETIPITITTQPISTLRASLLPSPTAEPQWWTGQFSSFRRSTETKQKRAARRPTEPAANTLLSPSPEKHRSLSRRKSNSETPLAAPSSSPRGLRARGAVQYTDTPSKHAPMMDTTDAFYALLHRKHEQAEKKLKLRETEKMVLARNKLRGRIELLEGTEDGVWRARMEKLLKKAARYAGDDGGAQSDLGSDEEKAGEKGERRAGMTEDELAEKVQRLVLLAGIELVRRTSAEQLKDELISEGKELLEKYNRTLGMRGGRYLLKGDLGVRNVQSDAEDGGKVRTARHPSTELEKSETPELDIVDSKRFKRRRIAVSHDSDDDSLSPLIDLEPLPLDAAARSDGESVYQEATDTKPKKKHSERRPSSRRAAHTPSAPLIPEPPRERIYLPVTATGQPVLIEAAEKRLAILQAEAEKKRLEEEAKSKRKKVPEMRSKSHRVLAAPFGMPMPDSVGFHNEYDLDGPFWIPYLKARQEGGFTLQSMGIQNGADSSTAAVVPHQEVDPEPRPVLPTASGGGKLLAGPVPVSDTPQTLTSLSATPDLPGDRALSQISVLPTTTSPLLTVPPAEDVAVIQAMEVIEDSPRNTQTDEYPPSDIVPDSQPASDVVPSSWRTEEAVPSSAG